MSESLKYLTDEEKEEAEVHIVAICARRGLRCGLVWEVLSNFSVDFWKTYAEDCDKIGFDKACEAAALKLENILSEGEDE